MIVWDAPFWWIKRRKERDELNYRRIEKINSIILGRNKPGSMSSLTSWICIPWPTPLMKYSNWSSKSSTTLPFIFFLIITTAFTSIISPLLLPPLELLCNEPLLTLLSTGDDVVVLLSPPLITAWTWTLCRSDDREMILLRCLLSENTDGDRRSKGLDFTANMLTMRSVS